MKNQVQFAELLVQGDLVVIPQAVGEPLTLVEQLIEQRHVVERLRVFLGVSLSDNFKPEHADVIDFSALGGSRTTERLVDAGVCDILPIHLSDIPRMFNSTLTPDVVLLHLSGDSVNGRHAVGLSADYVPAALKHARVVIGEVNKKMPFVYGAPTVSLDDLTTYITTDRELIEVPRAPENPLSRAIAEHITPYIPPKATLQIGIGSIPNVILGRLSDRHDLGVHTGLLSDGLADLITSGAITNARKPFDQGVSVAGAIFGTRDLYDFVHMNKAISLQSLESTHDRARLAQLDTFCSIQSAISVDVTGQVNAELVGTSYRGSVGSQVEFVRAARAAPNGVAIIAMPATSRDDSSSRIVSQGSMGTVTTPRCDVDIVVTEYGVADLRFLSLRDRVTALTAIAAPQFRDGLVSDALDMRGRNHRLIEEDLTRVQ